MRNSKRKVMMTAPTSWMTVMIARKLPYSTFIGTREMEQIAQERCDLDVDRFLRNYPEVSITIIQQSSHKKYIFFRDMVF